MTPREDLEAVVRANGFNNSRAAPHLFYNATKDLRYRFSELSMQLERRPHVKHRHHRWPILRAAYYKNLHIIADEIVGWRNGGHKNGSARKS